MKPQRDKEAAVERHTQAAIERLSPANRDLVARLVRRRANQGIKVNSNQAFVFAIRHVDTAVKGKAFPDLTADDLEDAVAELRRRLSPGTVFIALRNFRRALAMIYPEERVPEPLLKAMTIRRPSDTNIDRLLSDQEFHAILEAAASHRSGRTTLTPDLSVAVCWTLWDSGFRAHELLALRVESCRFEADGLAILSLPKDAPLLKTGWREIAVGECVQALKAWLSLHPAGGNPKAPLFPGFYDKTGLRPLSYESLSDHLRLLARRAGVANPPALADITPHDFRHTCATRKARAGWVESQLRLYFGWKSGSNMPSKYVHLALSDLRERVRRDVGITATAFPTATPSSDSELLVQLLQRLARGDATARTAAPPNAPQR